MTAWTPPDFLPNGVWLFKDGHRDDDWFVTRREPPARAYPPDFYCHIGTESGSPRIRLSSLANLFGVRFRELVMPPENKIQISRGK